MLAALGSAPQQAAFLPPGVMHASMHTDAVLPARAFDSIARQQVHAVSKRFQPRRLVPNL
jgi:hypothetical protein